MVKCRDRIPAIVCVSTFLIILIVGLGLMWGIPVQECETNADCSFYAPYGCVNNVCNCSTAGTPHKFQCSPFTEWYAGQATGFWIVLFDLVFFGTLLCLNGLGQLPGGEGVYDDHEKRIKKLEVRDASRDAALRQRPVQNQSNGQR